MDFIKKRFTTKFGMITVYKERTLHIISFLQSLVKYFENVIFKLLKLRYIFTAVMLVEV